MTPRSAWLSDLFWQFAAIAAVPGAIALAIAFAGATRPEYPPEIGDHAHTRPICQYCIAHTTAGMQGVPAPGSARATVPAQAAYNH